MSPSARTALAGEQIAISELKLAKNGKILLTHDVKGGLAFWDLASGEAFPTPLPVCPPPIPARCFGFLDDGKTIVTVAEDGVVRIWKARSGKTIRQFGIADTSTWRDWAALSIGVGRSIKDLLASSRPTNARWSLLPKTV